MYRLYFLSLNSTDYSVVPAVVLNNLRSKSRFFKYSAHSLPLFLADLYRKQSSVCKLFCPQRHKPTIKVQSVLAPEQRKLRLECYFLLKSFHIRRAYIRRI